ncbi:MAG: hypothetical protein GY781_19640 [Gammaproteobacteria bacterium]|nr:hypothetical protein [Gammaproteobacteria bacterium]
MAFDFKKGFHAIDLSKYLKYLSASLDYSLHTHHQSKRQTKKKTCWPENNGHYSNCMSPKIQVIFYQALVQAFLLSIMALAC